MKIIIIRHGEPDYEHNTLTENGFKEINALGEYYQNFEFDEAYTSPLPRAKLTADAFMKYHKDKPCEIKEWLKEFNYHIKVPYSKNNVISWDLMPKYYDKEFHLFDYNYYLNHPWLKSGHIKEIYQEITREFDKILATNGYVREHNIYRVIDSNKKTIIFFCHFGMMSVLLSHLLNIPYIALAQQTECQTTGVTKIVTEEREQGIAQFRMLNFSDITHLKVKNIEPSFSGRFCETFNSPERH